MTSSSLDILKSYHAKIRINNWGEALEIFVKDLLAGTTRIADNNRKNIVYSEYFSYMGNQNNPPDLIIKDGDAIEVKKIENNSSRIALNSSYPKDKLYKDSNLINEACRNCEIWSEKDIIYSIGTVASNKLRSLWFVYGNCFAANKQVYEKISKKIIQGINEIPNIELSKTNELGRVNKVDPLGITYLRVRGMWGIEHPKRIFSYINGIQKESRFSAYAIMLKEKFDSFPEKDKFLLKQKISKNFSIKNINIKSPDNPAKLLNAKLLMFKN